MGQTIGWSIDFVKVGVGLIQEGGSDTSQRVPVSPEAMAGQLLFEEVQTRSTIGQSNGSRSAN